MNIFRRIQRVLTTTLFVATGVIPAAAQQPEPDVPLKIGNVVFSGSIRTRTEGWDWFAPKTGSNLYGYSETLVRFGFSENTEHLDWKVEFAAPVLLGLPDHSVLAAPQGQLGFGGNYYAANNRQTNAAFVFPKLAYLKLHGGDVIKQSLQLGRFEFNEGTELAPENKTLAALDRDRISQRLIGIFGFSVTGRSSDGGAYSIGNTTTNFTATAFRPTRGVYQTDGWGEVDIAVAYAAFSHIMGGPNTGRQFRVFAIEYDDFRDNVLKTDNRPVGPRTADHSNVDIQTYGADFIGTAKGKGNAADILLWGVAQGGNWGVLRQKAYAYALEGGWQPSITNLKPWLRAGYDYSSGDHNPNDRTHGTFFQILPTARVYARFPFFNMMDMRDAFGELILRPGKKLVIRSDIHSLALANKHDLWYVGGGAYQPWSFGYIGRPSNGATSLATLYDISADYPLTKHTASMIYYGHATGKSVISAIYPANKDGNLGLLELTYRF